MSRLPGPLGSIPQVLSRAMSDVHRAAEAAAALPDLARSLLGTVEALRGDLRAGVGGLRTDLRDGMGGLRSDLTDLHAEIARLRPLPEGIERLEHLLARVDKSVAPVEGLERELRDGVAVVIARLDLLLDGIGAMRADLTSTRDDLAPVDDELAAVERAVKDMAPALGDVRDEITALRDDLSSLPLVGRKSTPHRSD